MLRSREAPREAPERLSENDVMTPENKTSAIRDEPPVFPSRVSRGQLSIANRLSAKQKRIYISDSTTYTPDNYCNKPQLNVLAARRPSKPPELNRERRLPAKTRPGGAPQWRPGPGGAPFMKTNSTPGPDHCAAGFTITRNSPRR